MQMIPVSVLETRNGVSGKISSRFRNLGFIEETPTGTETYYNNFCIHHMELCTSSVLLDSMQLIDALPAGRKSLL